MDEFEKNYNRALRFLSFRPRSEKEIKDYLTRKKVSSDIQQKIIKKLKEYKFLDDKQFASWWIEQRTKLKPKAWRVIKSELKQKGINVENLELKMPSDFEMAFALAQKRLKKYKNLPKQEFFEKMGRHLASKGFNYDIIKEVIAKIG